MKFDVKKVKTVATKHEVKDGDMGWGCFMKRVYLSGAITNNDNALLDFGGAELVLSNHFDVFNPMSLQGKYKTEQEYMKRDILELAKCDYICFVNKFSETSNANLEASVAIACGIKEIKIDDSI